MAGEHLQRAVHVRAIDGGNGAHGQTMLRRKWSKQALSEQQGGIRELTAQTVEEERARAKLSTGACRRRGRSSVEGSVWWRRDSGKRQNGTGEVCRSSWRGKTGNGEGVRADLVRRRKRPGRLGFCSWGPTEGGEGLWRCGSV